MIGAVRSNRVEKLNLVNKSALVGKTGILEKFNYTGDGDGAADVIHATRQPVVSEYRHLHLEFKLINSSLYVPAKNLILKSGEVFQGNHLLYNEAVDHLGRAYDVGDTFRENASCFVDDKLYLNDIETRKETAGELIVGNVFNVHCQVQIRDNSLINVDSGRAEFRLVLHVHNESGDIIDLVDGGSGYIRGLSRGRTKDVETIITVNSLISMPDKGWIEVFLDSSLQEVPESFATRTMSVVVDDDISFIRITKQYTEAI